jgi:hypothetical protein
MASKKMGVLAEQTPAITKEENDHEGEMHANDLMRAGEILNNPEKMKKAMIHIGKKKLAIKSVADIKAYHQEKYGKAGTAPKNPNPDAGASPETDGSEIEA